MSGQTKLSTAVTGLGHHSERIGKTKYRVATYNCSLGTLYTVKEPSCFIDNWDCIVNVCSVTTVNIYTYIYKYTKGEWAEAQTYKYTNIEHCWPLVWVQRGVRYMSGGSFVPSYCTRREMMCHERWYNAYRFTHVLMSLFCVTAQPSWKSLFSCLSLQRLGLVYLRRIYVPASGFLYRVSCFEVPWQSWAISSLRCLRLRPFGVVS